MPIVNQIFPQVQAGQSGLGPLTLQQVWPSFDIEIPVPSALQEILTQNRQIVPPPARGRALIDTGATLSAVDEAVMIGLGVPVVGQIRSGTVGGQHTMNQYPARFTFNNIGGISLSFESTRATGVRLAGQGFVALVGRDVLANMVLIYNGPMGTVTLTF
jgi:hypothetical protein